jgi:hypothetical protein
MNPSDTDTPETLSPTQAKIVDALAQGCTITAAAAEAGVHRVTVYKRLNTGRDFQSAVQQARAGHKLTVDDELVEMSRLALSTLREFLQDSGIAKALRLRAALAFLARPRSPRQEWALPKPAPIRVASLPGEDDGPAPATPATPSATHPAAPVAIRGPGLNQSH